MKRRIIILFVIAMFLLSNTAYGDIAKFSYSFEEALKMALDNSAEYKEMDKKSRDLYDDYDEKSKHTPSEVRPIDERGKQRPAPDRYILEVASYMNMEILYNNYKMAKWSKDSIKKNIELGLRETIIGIEKAKMALKEKEINTKEIDKQEKILDLQYELGFISKIDYNKLKRDIKDNIKFLDDIDKAEDMTYHQLNMLLGRKDDKDITIKLDSTIIPLEKLNLEQIKKDMIKLSSTSINGNPLKALYEERNLKKQYFSLLNDYFEEYLEEKYDKDKLDDRFQFFIDDYWKKAKKDFEIADQKYNNALKRFDKIFDDMIEDIEDLYVDIEDFKEKIADEKANKDIYKLKYDSGLISKMEYDSLKDNLTLLENKLKQAELDLNMAYAKLLIYSDLKKVVLE